MPNAEMHGLRKPIVRISRVCLSVSLIGTAAGSEFALHRWSVAMTLDLLVVAVTATLGGFLKGVATDERV